MEELDRESKVRQTTRSSLIRESLEKTLRTKPAAQSVTCHDLARDLAGSVKGLPRDLAHNAKYMDGFGE
jgi:hypothetical protein